MVTGSPRCVKPKIQEQGKGHSGAKEVKTEVQKLYRYVQQMSQRLDLKLQSAVEWKELFDPETMLMRQKLRDACENLLFSATHETARKVEEYLWRKVYYDIIQKFKQDKRALLKDTVLLAAYDAHLCAAIGFYNHLLMRLHQCFRVPLRGTVDWMIDPRIFSNDRHDAFEDSNESERKSWALKASQRCLIYLGDLARYHYDVFGGNCPELAERYYYMAVILNPSYGMPHNQLGTLRQAMVYGCETVYHYMRCLLSPVSFDGAEENLKRTLEKHKQMMQQWTRDRKIDQLSPKDAFLCFFLQVQDYFCGYSSVTLEEITQTGHQSLYAFNQSLEMVFAVTKQTSTDNEPTTTSVFLTPPCLVKLFCVCIMNISQLKRKGIQLCTVALSFLIALITKLLEHSTRILKSYLAEDNTIGGQDISWPASPSRSPNKNEVGVDSLPIKEPSPEDRLNKLRKKVLKMNKRRRRRRKKRRQTISDEEGESSEGSMDHRSDEDISSDEETPSDLSEGDLEVDCLSSDDGTSSETEVALTPVASEGSLGDVRSIPHKKDRADITVTLSSKEKRQLAEIGATAMQLSKNDNKSDRIRHMPQAWEVIVKENPAFGNLFERVMEDTTFPKTLHEVCYFPVVKIIFDFLKCSYKEYDFENEVNKPLWNAISEFFNCLPPRELYTFAAAHKKRLLDFMAADSEETLQGVQRKSLPEDVLVYGMVELASAHEKLDFSWTQSAANTQLLQCIVRDKCIRSFRDFVISVKNPFVSLNKDTSRLLTLESGKQDNDNFAKHNQMVTVPEAGTSSKIKELRGKSTEFMKALAKQKLEFDVTQLETTLKSTNISTNNLSAYLVMETQALCRHLSLIRSLLKSGEFIIIIPKQVVSSLDDLKKYNPGAREAIKFLEEEFRRGNRWLKSQEDSETVSEEITAPGQRRNKSLSVDDWRFFQIVRCACYFGRQVRAECLVSILTSDNFQQNGLGPSAIRLLPQVSRFCQECGVQIQSAVSFYKRWTAVRK